jgi:hypothetical protein
MLRLPIATCLSALLASASLAMARPGLLLAPLADTLPRAVHWGPPEVLKDSSVLGRWEINTEEFENRANPDFHGRMVIHFYADHSMEAHTWSMDIDSNHSTQYRGYRLAGTWFVRDTLLGMIKKECEGFTASDARECGSWESSGDFGHDTGMNVIQPFEGERYMHDTGMFAMLAWRYRGPDRDVTPPSFWSDAIPVRVRAYGLRQNPGSAPTGPVYDLLGRRPGTVPAVTPRFRLSDPLRSYR